MMNLCEQLNLICIMHEHNIIIYNNSSSMRIITVCDCELYICLYVNYNCMCSYVTELCTCLYVNYNVYDFRIGGNLKP
jgi:hypothetical protein